MRTTKRGTPKEDTLLVVEEVVEVTEDRPIKVFGNGLIEEVGVTGISETNDGVCGVSRDGGGVRGKSTNGNGVVAESLTDYALVAMGENGAASLVGYVKIVGDAHIQGKLNADFGLTALSENSDAVRGISGDGHGVHGKSTNGNGVVAESLTDYALVAMGENGAASLVGYVKIVGDTHIQGKLNVDLGLTALSETNDAVRGVSHDGVGVRGKSTNGHGVVAESVSTTHALHARGQNAALLEGDVHIRGNDIAGSSSTSALNVTAGKNGTAARIVGDFSIEGKLTGKTVTDLENKILDLQATIERICNYLASISSENSLASISPSKSASPSH